MTGPQEAQLEIAAGLVPGPDGSPWVALQLHWGASIHGLMMPLEIAEKLGPALTAKLAETVAQARRARLGLIVADGSGGIPPMTATTDAMPWRGPPA